MVNAKLYIVPTPIGNLKDITLRAIEVLKSVDIIACEDTRVSQKLLKHYEISTKLMSYHKFSEKEKSGQIVELLKEGKNVALISDAGTPIISDPGCELLKAMKENDIEVVPLAGASAFTTLISASSTCLEDYVFVGFLPRKENEQSKVFEKYPNANIVFYESPSRLLKSLKNILETQGDIEIVVGRELTKLYEEIKSGKVSEVIEYYSKSKVRGEIACLVINKKESISYADKEILEKARLLNKQGYSSKEVSKILSEVLGLKKNYVYNLIVEK